MIDTITIKRFGDESDIFLFMKLNGKIYLYNKACMKKRLFQQGTPGRYETFIYIPDYGDADYIKSYRVENFLESKIKRNPEEFLIFDEKTSKKKIKEQLI